MASKERKDAAQARRIAALMDAANITCPELSRRLDVSRNTPHLWRSGKRYPSRALQPRLAKLLGVSVAELNGWTA